MSVSVASCSLKQLFSGDCIYASNGKPTQSELPIQGQLTIPEYQRPYRWNEEQIKRLLSDYKENLTVSPFYLGSVILHQCKERKFLNIIDGQQRLTTLALIAFTQDKSLNLSMSYQSPESQIQISKNLKWLNENREHLPQVELGNINLTLVVTQSEDDAYRFFETQNTGGVRLEGPDIIKAHHLRAIDRNKQSKFASLWEDLGDLNPVVNALLKGRHWQNLNFRQVPSHRQPQLIRVAIVTELAEHTGQGEDIGYGRIIRTFKSDGSQLHQQPQLGYELRQPLNAGINTVHYLAYFESLRTKYLSGNTSESTEFNSFYNGFISRLDGCSYLKNLFDTCLLLYISQFGEQQLCIAAKKLFRVVYSLRVSNQKSVRELSISSFLRETPVLDWIANSYTPQICFDYLDQFNLKVDPANLQEKDNSVKKKFVLDACRFFAIDIDLTNLAEQFGQKLDQEIKGISLKGQLNVK